MGISAFAAALLLPALEARGAVTVLVGEPYGSFGTMMPVGHSAVYLDRVCADGPVRLRMCQPGEPAGVAIARYHRIGQTDWIATPIMQFLYATGDADDVPVYATAEMVRTLRLRYRERFLLDLVPEDGNSDSPSGEWWETAGVAYVRRLWGYQMATTEMQDEELVEFLNARANRRVYTLRKRNCANFAADIVNFYYPGAVKLNRLADLGMMTPKQVARCVEAYGKGHPQTDLQVFEVPQVPGSFRRSRPVRGTAEAGLKTKRYLAALSVMQPEAVAAMAVFYLERGRWRIGVDAEPMTPADFDYRREEEDSDENMGIAQEGLPGALALPGIASVRQEIQPWREDLQTGTHPPVCSLGFAVLAFPCSNY